ncbi:3D-(3,5/4)-trihydroxycyclohexane-1,2-dione acylhydrolase (decyclizing) [Stigmatella aurantiaca]|uniref:Myo-inositol catabolism protein n=1 Tax=Stigmatella aurantiaca (strain DW4/3-1) TaxID=378806 RepID=Q09EA2_STIAD|nr:3D-(3,5/4)-trihydroxycyclohexane-1,2-dione acylhydrolase (decyclizing) [Stigmatella aurantiaca]ADO74688.1 Thiamine pyrophosphate enzyme [Stigmatella aurantiaca DW4/3-1]EAU69985.1 myo-inositol catabolism protein [Stigmatella aurantiaca DW4/3-1]
MVRSVRITLAQAVVRFLDAQRVSRDGEVHRFFRGVFGIFGHGNVTGLGQALEEHEGLPFFQPKNEQGMVHAAIAYAKARRRLSAFACTSSIGPGATNMVTGAATATINRLPVLLLPGDIFANRAPQPVLQQLECPHSMDVSVNDCFRPVSRYWDRIQRPEQILSALPEAMRVLADPAETGAVTLCLPQDVQAEAFDCPAHFLQERVHVIERRPCARERLVEAAALLRQARRPFCIVGGGVHYAAAEEALRRFADVTGIPVGVTQAGMGALPDAHGACLGAVGVTGTGAANRIAHDADVVLTIGTRLSDFTTASKTQFQAEGVRFIAINVSAFDAAKHGALPLVGDARLALEELTKALEGWRIPSAYGAEVGAAREAWAKTREELTRSPDGKLTQAEVIRVLNDEAGPGSTVVHAAGGIPGDIHKLWRSKEADDYHSEYGYSCMGYEVAGALGVKLAHPQREVYALLGDGSYLMLSQELLTSIQEGAKITAVLLDNHGYQCIHNLQRGSGSRSFGNEFRARKGERLEGEPLAVDFVQNAQSLGARTFTATTASELSAALRAARTVATSCLIYIPLEASPGLPGTSWWDVPIAEVSPCSPVREKRAAYEDAKKKQRFYY